MADEAVVDVVDRYGAAKTIPLSELSKAQERGYRLAGGEEIHQAQRAEKYDDPLAAAGEGIARGLTFGVSDIGGTDAMAARRQYNPLAAGVGEVGGAVAGLGLTGIGGAAGAAGEAAFGGSGLLARAGAAAVRGGIEGGAMGLGQGISDVALSQDPMSAEAIAGAIGHHVLVGAGAGAVGGAGLSVVGSGLGAALGAAGKVVSKTAAKVQAELADDTLGGLATADPALRSEVMAMSSPALKAAHKAEASTLEAVKAEQGSAFAKDLESFHAEATDTLDKLKNELPRGQGITANPKILDKVLGDLKTLAEDPARALGPLRRFEQQVSKMGEVLPDGTVKPLLDQMTALQDRIGTLSDSATSPRLEAIAERLKSLGTAPKATPLLDAMGKGVGASVGGAIGHASGIPGMGFAGAWLGKELGETIKPVMKKVLGAFADHAGAIEDGASKLLSKLTPPPAALDALRDLATATTVEGEGDYEKATKAIAAAAADPAQTQAHLTQQMAGLAAANPQLAEKTVEQLMLRVNFLASKIQPQISMGLAGKLLPPSDSEQSTFARYVAAASDPLRLLKELRAGMLMPETIETHDALYPAMKAKIEAAITTHLADPTVASKVPYSMRLQLGMLLGPGVDPTLDPSFVALMQSSYQQQPDVKPPSGGSATNPNDPATAAQRLTMR